MKPFPWRVGMAFASRVKDDGCLTADRLCEGQTSNNGFPISDEELQAARPDPTDGATKGALLDAVREAWGCPMISICAYDGPSGGWVVERYHEGSVSWLTEAGTWDTCNPLVRASEFEALEAARMAAP